MAQRRKILSARVFCAIAVWVLALGCLGLMSPGQAQDVVVKPKPDTSKTQSAQTSPSQTQPSHNVPSAVVQPGLQPSDGSIAPIFEARKPVVIDPGYLQCKEDGDCVFAEGDCGGLVVANKGFTEQVRAALPKCVDPAGADSRIAEMTALFRRVNTPVCRNKSCVIEDARAVQAPQ